MKYQLQFGNAKPIDLKVCTTKANKAGETHTYLGVRPDDTTFVPGWGFNVPIATVGGKLHDSVKLLGDGKLVATIPLKGGVTSTGNAKREAQVDDIIEHDGFTCKLQIRVSLPHEDQACIMTRSVRPATARTRVLVTV